jgi:monovalent cation:H+ antiporter-2, CPA2 family
MEDAQDFLETLTAVLCVAAVTTVLFQRLRQPVVLGYLLAGMVVGPHIPIPLVADSHIVGELAELGVILLMFSLGIEFSLTKLARVGPTAGFVAIVQCSLMLWLGYLIGQAFGWSRLASLYAGAIIAISSTTIIVKAFQEQRIRGDFTHVVFGVLIVEDLIAIVLIAILTALSAGESLGPMELALTGGRLALFLVVLTVVGLLTVPRAMRAVHRLGRNETTVVATVGLAFGFASLASLFGYSVALGAFIAGGLVAESGVERTIERLVQPVTDVFAAVFFVSVGMLIDPVDIVAHWVAVLVFLAAVVVGKVVSVTFSAFLTGQSIQSSVKSGMSLAQIGEFSFIIAGIGVATNATEGVPLYSIAVAVSGLTTLLTPWLIRAAEPTAALVDRKLPRRMQTFAALYGSWFERMRSTSANKETSRVRRLARWLAVDAALFTGIIITASIQSDDLRSLCEQRLNVPPRLSTLFVVVATAILSAPFGLGMVRMARVLGLELAIRAFPNARIDKTDLADAPRRLLIVTLQMAIIVLVGLPVLAITQPFLPRSEGALVLIVLLGLLALQFWRGATNFQGHTRAVAQAIAEALRQETHSAQAAASDDHVAEGNPILVGLGSPISVRLAPHSSAIGRTLAEVNLRGVTGATVLAIRRGETVVPVPSGHERLLAGDILAVAGQGKAIEAARELLQNSG